MKIINVVKDFSASPGARYKTDGPKSGEEFRELFLEPLFSAGGDEVIEINFDGADGYATSFLEETFGGLVRQFGKDPVVSRLRFVSNDDPLLVDEIMGYIDEAAEQRQ